VVLDRPNGNGIYPSDHYGVLVDLEAVSNKATRPGSSEARRASITAQPYSSGDYSSTGKWPPAKR
jgi:hypothetical protein